MFVTTTLLQVALLEDVSVRGDACGLEDIPDEIFQKSSLRELVLSKNAIAIIPAAIARLSSLRVLRMDRNLLTHLPPEIGQLSALASLDLSGNKVRGMRLAPCFCLFVENPRFSIPCVSL